MNGWQEIEFSIGLRHVLEDSLALLSGNEIAPDRKDVVLRDVCSFMEQAKYGSETTAAATFVASALSATAVETYALLFRHLDSNFKSALDSKIQTTADVMAKLCRDEQLDPENVHVAEDLIGHLLSSLAHERALSVYAMLETSEAS